MIVTDVTCESCGKTVTISSEVVIADGSTFFCSKECELYYETTDREQKPRSFFNAGYVYAPWVPMFKTPTVILDDFTLRKDTLKFYGEKYLDPSYYSN